MVGALACAAALVLPASAATDPESDIEDAIAVFALEGTHGYSMLVFASPDGDEPVGPGGRRKGAAIVLLSRGGDSVAYLVRASLTADFLEGRPTVTSLQLDLGQEGRLALQFPPAGGKGLAPARCGLNSTTYAKGTYEGSIEFHGRGGFTDVAATSAAQHPEALAGPTCATEIVNETRGSRLRGARLAVEANHRDLELQVNQNRPGAPVRAEVSVGEGERDKLFVQHKVIRTLPPRAFSFDPKLRRARLSPGAPFAGRAIYRRNAKPSKRWTGNLSVDLPGRAHVPLAGPGFSVRIDHAVRRVTGHGASTDRLAQP